MVTLQEDPIRVHLEQYDIIGEPFKPRYYIRSGFDQDSLIGMIYEHTDDPEKLPRVKGTVSIDKNNHDVTIHADPKLFMGIAEEIEKLGYGVTIIY